MQRMNPSIIVYKYSSENLLPVIILPKDISYDITFLKCFFMYNSVKSNGGHTWFQVWLGYDDSNENILISAK